MQFSLNIVNEVLEFDFYISARTVVFMTLRGKLHLRC